MKLLLLLVVGMVVLLQLPQEGLALCCPPDWGLQCKDCHFTLACCGIGACNVFCCNCDYGCVTGSCSAQNQLGSVVAGQTDARDVIAAGDVDKDGKLSLEEARNFLAHKQFPEDDVKRVLREMDLDGDRFLSAGEIDSDFLPPQTPNVTTHSSVELTDNNI